VAPQRLSTIWRAATYYSFAMNHPICGAVEAGCRSPVAAWLPCQSQKRGRPPHGRGFQRPLSPLCFSSALRELPWARHRLQTGEARSWLRSDIGPSGPGLEVVVIAWLASRSMILSAHSAMVASSRRKAIALIVLAACPGFFPMRYADRVMLPRIGGLP